MIAVGVQSSRKCGGGLAAGSAREMSWRVAVLPKTQTATAYRKTCVFQTLLAMAKKKKKYAVPTGPKKGAGGSRGISKLKGQKAAAQTAVAADGDGLFAAPGTHVAKKRKAAPEDPGLEDADQYMQPARKKKKKEQQQPVAPLSADSTAETEQCTHKYIADAAQPQQLQGQQRKQKWWQPKQPLKQKQKQKRKKALAQQLQLRAQKRNGQGALEPNKAAVAVAGGQLSWCVAGYPMQGAPGAVTVTQWHAMAGVGAASCKHEEHSCIVHTGATDTCFFEVHCDVACLLI
jgi:hypothetical protein